MATVILAKLKAFSVRYSKQVIRLASSVAVAEAGSTSCKLLSRTTEGMKNEVEGV